MTSTITTPTRSRPVLALTTATNPAAAADTPTEPPAVAPQGWMAAAACQYTDPEVFFPEKGESSLPARRICHRCPVLTPCLQWALTGGELHGVLGGQSVHDRRALAAAMRAWACAEQLPCPSRGSIPLEVQQAYLAANAVVAA